MHLPGVLHDGYPEKFTRVVIICTLYSRFQSSAPSQFTSLHYSGEWVLANADGLVAKRIVWGKFLKSSVMWVLELYRGAACSRSDFQVGRTAHCWLYLFG